MPRKMPGAAPAENPSNGIRDALFRFRWRATGLSSRPRAEPENGVMGGKPGDNRRMHVCAFAVDPALSLGKRLIDDH